MFGEAWIVHYLAPIVGWREARAAGVGWDGDCRTGEGDRGEWRTRWATPADAEEFGAAARLWEPTAEVRCAGVECTLRWAASAGG